MIDLRSQITNYRPYDQHEKSDQTSFLYCMDIFPDILTRENPICHATSSCWILNRNHTGALMLFHNIEQKWMWPGGHVDGETDFAEVALREAKEETSLSSVNLVNDQIFSLEVLNVPAHIRKGKFVSAHLHLDCSYLLEADDTEPFKTKPDENSAIRWMDFAEIETAIDEGAMEKLYRKLITKTKEN